MKHWLNQNYKTLIIAAFLIPIITVAIVSISHVSKWYGISNPFSWAIYLSIGIEIAALSALAAISANMGKKVYFPFAIVTLIQFIGNIFFAHTYIDVNSQSFKDWVDLVSPLVSFMGVEPTDLIGHKRFLAFFAGGMLPIISLSFLHMLVKFTEEDRMKEIEKDIEEKITNQVDAKDIVSEVSRLRLSEKDLEILEKHLLNPQPPSEQLKHAVEEYKKNVSEEEPKKEPFSEMMIKQENDFDIDEDDEEEDVTPANYISKEETQLVIGKILQNQDTLFPNLTEQSKENIENSNIEEVLSNMTQENQDMGLYDEPLDNPLIKEKPADWEPTISDNFTIGPDGAYERDDDWDVTLMDGFYDEDNVFHENPSIEDEVENFSTIEPNTENIFQDNFTENEIIEEISQNVKQDEPEITEEDILENLTNFENETFSEKPITLDIPPVSEDTTPFVQLPENEESSIPNKEDEKKNL